MEAALTDRTGTFLLWWLYDAGGLFLVSRAVGVFLARLDIDGLATGRGLVSRD